MPAPVPAPSRALLVLEDGRTFRGDSYGAPGETFGEAVFSTGVSGYVVRDPARRPSSWRSQRSLDDALRDQGVVGISGIDTRALTRHLRERGAMRVGISSVESDPLVLLSRVREQAGMAGAELAGEVSTGESYVVPALPGPW